MKAKAKKIAPKKRAAPPPPVIDPGMKVEWWPIDRLVPYPANARKLELALVPVHVAAGLTAAQVKAYRLMDNRSADEAVWDLELLQGEMAELQGQIDTDLTGFEQREVERFLAEENKADPDVIPEPGMPVTLPGDLWALGKHRVLCGDSTNADALLRLQAGSKADIAFTDPPYGIGFLPEAENLKKLGKLKNDHRRGRWDGYDEFSKFITVAMQSLLSGLKEGACYYVCMGWEHLGCVTQAMASNDSRAYSVLVWDRVTPRLTSFPQDYIPVNEFIVYGWKRGKNRQRPSAGSEQTTIWRFKTEKAADMVHTTQKPVAVIENALLNSSAEGQLVLDLFGGSGTTLIGCEMTRRTAFLMELDPKYVDVIVARWELYTGQRATLDGDGRTFEQVAKARK